MATTTTVPRHSMRWTISVILSAETPKWLGSIDRPWVWSRHHTALRHHLDLRYNTAVGGQKPAWDRC